MAQTAAQLAQSMGAGRAGMAARPNVSQQLMAQIQARGLQAPAQQASDDDEDSAAVYVGTVRPKARPTDNTMGPYAANPVPFDRTMTIKDLQKEFYGKSRNDIIALQQRLEKAGFLEAGSYRKGVHDESTLEGYTKMLSRAASYYTAGQKKTIDDVLAEGESNPLEVEHDPFNPQITNPADLRRTIAGTASVILGHALDDKSIDQLVAQYNQQEIAAQKQEYDLKVNRQDGTVVQPQDAKSYAMEQVRAKDPLAAAQLDVQDQLSGIASMASSQSFNPANIGRGGASSG